MERIFLNILNMSLTGSIVILCVLLARIILRRAPKLFSYLLWAVVLFRLLCPVSFSAHISLFGMLHRPVVEQGQMIYFSADMQEALDFGGENVLPIENNQNTGLILQTPAPTDGDSKDILLSRAMRTGTLVWLTGISALAAYSLFSLLKLKKRLKDAVCETGNIYRTRVQTPFVIGIFRPRIYLPDTLKEGERDYILLHEQIHIRRGDHIVKLIGFAAFCLHWFNPLVWLAFFLGSEDMEMSCDEAVLKKNGKSVKKEYSASLLCLATGSRRINGMPLAFGEGDTGSRIKNVLRYQKPKVWLVAAAAAVCAAAAVMLAANPFGVQADSGATDGSSFQVQAYGVVMESEMSPGRLVIEIPGVGTVEIPDAEEIYPYYEPGEEGFDALQAGQLVRITFPENVEPFLEETYPARYGVKAQEIAAMSSGGFALRRGEDGGYLLGIPLGWLSGSGTEPGQKPGGEEIRQGDMLHIYEDNQDMHIYGEDQGDNWSCLTEILSVDRTAECPEIRFWLSEADTRLFFSAWGHRLGLSLRYEVE